MSFPSIPRITPTISINRTQIINLLLASVALEEMGLAHIINVEGEKLQAILEKVHDHCGPEPSIANLMAMNSEVRRTLQTVLNSQILLKSKLEDILEIAQGCLPPHPYPPMPDPCPPPHPNHSHPDYCFDEHMGPEQNKFYYSPACKTCKFYGKCHKNQKHW